MTECVESAAVGGVDWVERLVDEKGQLCSTVVMYCSEKEIAAG